MKRIYALYLDESGDPGAYDVSKSSSSRTRHYIVSGLIIPIDTWEENLKVLANLKGELKSRYGFPVRKELHGAQIINPRNDKDFSSIGSRFVRNKMYLEVMQYCAKNITEGRIVNIHVDKTMPHSLLSFAGVDIQEIAWIRMLERYQTFLRKNNGLGLVFADDTNEIAFRRLLRKMRKYHYIPSMYGNVGLRTNTSNIIEDPIMRASHQSYFIQIADMTSHILYRKLYPKASYRKYRTEQIFDALDGMLIKEAHRKCPYGQGIVRV